MNAITRYQGRLSGPLLDRIDLQVEVTSIAPEELMGSPDGEPTATVAARVAQALSRQHARQGCANARLTGQAIDAYCEMDRAATTFLQNAATKLGWSARSFHRVLKVARTVADLAGSDAISTPHLAEAIQMRRGMLPM